MTTPEEKIGKRILQPGDFYFGQGRVRISTLLGSCVSITLWHPGKHIGGMCHYMVTERVRPVRAALDGRFGAEAFELFLRQVAAAGYPPSEYQAKLFGGANMFTSALGRTIDIGARNVAFGRRLLAEANIALVAEHVNGQGLRKLHFDLWNGDVWLAFPQGRNACTRSSDD